MSRTMMPKNKIRIATATVLGIIGLVGVFETVQNNTTKAINPREKSELDIRFYDDQACGSTAAADCGEVTGISEDDRLYSLLDHYAGLAQELQRQTGIPWELPFMHARGESGFCNTTFGDLKMLWDNYQSFNCKQYRNSLIRPASKLTLKVKSCLYILVEEIYHHEIQQFADH